MFAKLTSAALAAAIALAGVTVPAPAQALSQEEAARLFAGALGLYVIGRAIEDNLDGNKATKKETVRKEPERRVAPREVRPEPYREGYRERFGRDGWRNVPPAHGLRRNLLPGRCLVENRGRGPDAVLSKSCLDRNYPRASRLPQQCLRATVTKRGAILAYGPRCLAREGYRISRR